MASYLVIRKPHEKEEDLAIAPFKERLEKHCKKVDPVIENVWLVETEGSSKPPVVHHLGECHVFAIPLAEALEKYSM